MSEKFLTGYRVVEYSAQSTGAMFASRFLADYGAEILAVARREKDVPEEKIIGLGIAVRGIVSADGRRIVNSFGALRDRDYPLCEAFEKALGFKAIMANNVRALCLAETFLAREANEAELFLRCEYGIGAALSASLNTSSRSQPSSAAMPTILPRLPIRPRLSDILSLGAEATSLQSICILTLRPCACSIWYAILEFRISPAWLLVLIRMGLPSSTIFMPS